MRDLQHKVVGFIVIAAITAVAQIETQVTGWVMQDSTVIPTATGATISSSSYDASSWLSAVVPGTVLQTYVKAGTYPNPDSGENMYNMTDLASQQHRYWFRSSFSVTYAAGQRVWLEIPGINYYAWIFLNGNAVGTMYGAFREAKFDVTSMVTSGSTNYLAIRIRGNYNPGAYHTKETGTCGSNGGVMSQDGPTFIASQGWDWIPTVADRDMGIWKPVYVRVTGPAVLRHPWIRTTNVSAASATVPLQVTVMNTSGTSVTGTLAADIDGSLNFTSQSVTVGTNPDSQVIWFPILTMTNPTLWWPNGYGAPNLHTCHISFTPNSSTVSDTLVFQFGVRQFSSAGNPLVISCNGQRILVRGGNAGMDDMMKRWDLHKMENRIRYHKEMNFNMIRDWLGASDCEPFYQFCDQYGIMDWEDFWEPHSADQPVAVGDQANYIANMADKILRLRNHASVAVLCERNETAPTAAFWTALQGFSTTLDSGSRVLLQSSGTGAVHSGGPYTWSNVNANTVTGFHTELGAPTVPSYESMVSFLPTANQLPMGNNWWSFHDYCSGNGTPANYTNAMTNIWGAASTTDLHDCCKKAQLMNYDEYRSFFESLQYKRFNGATGLLLWMSNPVWPSTMWQTYDYYMEGTGAMYGCMHAAEPIHIQYYSAASNYVLVMNNTTSAISNYAVSAATYNLNGTRAWNYTGTVSVGADATSGNITTITAGTSTPYFLDMKLKDGSGNLVSHNFYWLPANGSSTSGMLTMTQGTVAMPSTMTSATWSRSGVENTITLKIVNTSSVCAVACRLLLTRATSGVRILPAHYNDNYFSLIPGDTQSVAVKFDEVDRNGENPQLCLTGVNIPQTCFTVGGVVFARRGAVINLAKTRMSVYFAGRRVELCNVPAGKTWQFDMFDMRGRTVLNAQGVGNGETAIVSAAKLRSGAYVATLRSGDELFRILITLLGNRNTEGR